MKSRSNKKPEQTLLTHWMAYSACVIPKNASPIQVSESRLVFYAGASALFTMLMSESSGAHTLDSVYSELQAIQSEVAARMLNASSEPKTKH
jgi:hypothetical protein